MQKKIKIIGLTVRENFGILRSCDIQFDESNRFIAVKGEVGAGKTTLRKSLELNTLGSDTLKHDKQLYGKIDQEVCLLDGDLNIFVGCKSNSKGGLEYVIYTKDANGKKVENPIVDGVSITPARYLKELQTALTWRMDEITSENHTVQRKVLLDLYKDDLEKVGVIFDKNHPNYVGSILDRIEKAELVRNDRDYARKQVGGFTSHLKKQGYDIEKPETLPSPIDVEDLNRKLVELELKGQNAEEDFNRNKSDRMQEIVNSTGKLSVKLREYNLEIDKKNADLQKAYDEELTKYNVRNEAFTKAVAAVRGLGDQSIIPAYTAKELVKVLEGRCELKVPEIPKKFEKIPMSNDRCAVDDWPEAGDIQDAIQELAQKRLKYQEISVEVYQPKQIDNTADIEDMKRKISLAKEVNKVCEGIKTFKDWQEADTAVSDLRREYIRKLSEVDTGVDGLSIHMDEEAEKLDLYLVYDGSYSPEYFSNPGKEKRKLSSYSGTQKPMICLLIQNFLLGRKVKALRYLWIDNVPIDSKTKDLLIEMCEKLDLTIFVNITGDFDKKTLNKGEILVEGGEVFFN